MDLLDAHLPHSDVVATQSLHHQSSPPLKPNPPNAGARAVEAILSPLPRSQAALGYPSVLTPRRLPYLNSVHTHPRRNQTECTCRQVHQHAVHHTTHQALLWWIVAVLSFLPQLVQARPTNHQRGIELQAIGAEDGVLEEFSGSEVEEREGLEAEDVAFVAHVGEIGHHVCDHFEAAVLGVVSDVM